MFRVLRSYSIYIYIASPTSVSSKKGQTPGKGCCYLDLQGSRPLDLRVPGVTKVALVFPRWTKCPGWGFFSLETPGARTPLHVGSLGSPGVRAIKPKCPESPAGQCLLWLQKEGVGEGIITPLFYLST